MAMAEQRAMTFGIKTSQAGVACASAPNAAAQPEIARIAKFCRRRST